MTRMELISVLDNIDKEFKTSLIRFKQLLLFFPNESKVSIKVSLVRHVKSGLITRVCNGLYFNHRSNFKPKYMMESIASYIRDNKTFYLSLESVLSEDGLISQLPNRLTFISRQRSQIFNTPLGIIEFVKTNSKKPFNENEIIFNEKRGILEATPKRALKDAYLHRRSINLIEEQRRKDGY